MPKLQPVQDVAIDVIDFIYFYDVAALTAFKITGESEVFIQKINAYIDEIINKREFVGVEAVIYKHFLLFALEMSATFNAEPSVVMMPERGMSKGDIMQYVRELHENAYDELLAEVKEYGFNQQLFESDAVCLSIETDIDQVSNEFCYGLVRQCLSYDFNGCISAHIYRKFLDLKILDKRKCDLNFKNKTIDSDTVFLRAMLFIEMEIMKSKHYHKYIQPEYMIKYDRQEIAKKRMEREGVFILKTYEFYRLCLNNNHKKVYKFDYSDTSQVKKYLLEIQPHFVHTKIFSQNNSRWISLFGLWHAEYNHLPPSKMPLFDALGEKESCSSKASDDVKKEYGFYVDARSIYDYRKKYSRLFELIHNAHQENRESEKVGFSFGSLMYFFNYHPDLSEKTLRVFDEIDEEIK